MKKFEIVGMSYTTKDWLKEMKNYPENTTYQDIVDKQLDNLGAVGWELVNVMHDKVKEGVRKTFYFKREYTDLTDKRQDYSWLEGHGIFQRLEEE